MQLQVRENKVCVRAEMAGIISSAGRVEGRLVDTANSRYRYSTPPLLGEKLLGKSNCSAAAGFHRWGRVCC